MAFKALCAILILCSVVYQALGHGYIRNPPARNACWQYGFPSCGKEWTMDEKNCGAVSTQWDKNKGKCGVCGDPYHLEVQKYVFPGSHATGTVVRTFTEGQEFELELMITVTHKGWSEFRIGDIGIPPITQDKLSHLLVLSSGGTRWSHNKYVKGKGLYKIKLRLPAGLTCSQCVIQWWWKTGNSWGCDNEGCGMGHGPQETFVNCADVRILKKGATIPTTAAQITPAPTQAPAGTSAPAGPCKAIGAWTGNPTMDNWCNSNCPTNCPKDMCACV